MLPVPRMNRVWLKPVVSRSLRSKVRPEIFTFAQSLRRNQTEHERLLWSQLKGSRHGGRKWRRQAIVRGFILDFYCPAEKLGIELDGAHHEAEADAKRDAVIGRCGIRVIRFWNRQLEASLTGVMSAIAGFYTG